MSRKYLKYRGALYQRVGADAQLEEQTTAFSEQVLGPISEAMDQMLSAFLQSGDLLGDGDPNFVSQLEYVGRYSRAIADLVDRLTEEGGRASNIKSLMERSR